MKCTTASSLPHSPKEEPVSCLPQAGLGGVVAPWRESPLRHQGLDQILHSLS